MAFPKSVQIVEVSPRDGLQNEKRSIATETKIRLIDMLSDTGLRHIEVGSFVSPKWVPQMADTADVFAGIAQKPGIVYSALVPNEKGLEGAVASRVKTIAVFIAASETFSKNNINATIAESLERLKPVFVGAKQHGMMVRGYVSCVVGCPFEGEIDPDKVASVSAELYKAGCYEISLGDTIGVGTADKTRAMVQSVLRHVPADKLAIHCHDTYGRAIENIEAAMELGVAVIDASVGGIGGCPYAKRANDAADLPIGNVATEKVLDMLAARRIESGLDRAKIATAGQYILSALGRG